MPETARQYARYTWQDLIVRATGEPLTPKYFVQQFVR